jgi:hypothetical protein
MTVVVRPARPEDVKRYYPDLSVSFKAYVAEVDGEPDGFIGLALTRPIACLVSATGDRLKPHLKSMPVLRAIKQMQEICSAHKGRVMAICDPDMATSPAILKRLGFRPALVVEGQDIYEMRRSE